MDQAHRLPKPKHLPEKIPRAVIARIHLFHVKNYAIKDYLNLSHMVTLVKLTNGFNLVLVILKSHTSIKVLVGFY